MRERLINLIFRITQKPYSQFVPSLPNRWGTVFIGYVSSIVEIPDKSSLPATQHAQVVGGRWLFNHSAKSLQIFGEVLQGSRRIVNDWKQSVIRQLLQRHQIERLGHLLQLLLSNCANRFELTEAPNANSNNLRYGLLRVVQEGNIYICLSREIPSLLAGGKANCGEYCGCRKDRLPPSSPHFRLHARGTKNPRAIERVSHENLQSVGEPQA